MTRRLLALCAAACAAAAGPAARADDAPLTLLNVSYDATREFYNDYDTLFTKYWKSKTGQSVTIQQSHGGSGAQARAVMEGLEADVVTLAVGRDVDAIAERTALVPADWARRLPDGASPYTSTVVFVVRKGNPKRIRSWADVARPGVAVVTANPKTSGGARYNFLAAYDYALRTNRFDDTKAQAFVTAVYRNVPVLDSGSRAARTTFVERGIGDVLLAWESEAILAARERPRDVEIVVPKTSILAEPPVAVVEANARKHGTLELARAYLQYLYSAAAQRLACRDGYRPRSVAAYAGCGTRFPRMDLTTVGRFGGWQQAQQRFFDDGGVFDRIYGHQ